MLTAPYVSPAAFRAHPTFLDTMNLRSGDSVSADQDAELYNVLLMASQWAADFLGMSDRGIHAHTVVESGRVRPDRAGRLKWHPSDIPVTSVTGLSWGYTPSDMRAVTDLSGVWVEPSASAGRQIVAVLGQLGGAWASIQFGPPSYSTEVYATWTYVAGYPTTTLTGAAAKGATSLTVADATGIAAGSVLRLWEPGTEEAVTVAAGYTSGTTIPLATALVYDHTSGAEISAMPPSIRLAVTNYAVASLMRPDTAAEDAFPDARVASSTRFADPRKDGSGLVVEAERLLRPYRRVR